MKSFSQFLLIILAFTIGSTFAQHGGKAEPERIKFASGGSIANVPGTLSTAEEMDFVFVARTGHKVKLRQHRIRL